MVRVRLTLIAAGILVLAGLIPVSSIPGSPVPAAAQLSEISFGFNCDGASTGSVGSKPVAYAGVFALTSATAGTGIETIHVGSVVTGPFDFTATYNEEADGTFTTTWTYRVGTKTFTQNFFGGSISKGTKWRAVETDPDYAVECTAETQ